MGIKSVEDTLTDKTYLNPLDSSIRRDESVRAFRFNGNLDTFVLCCVNTDSLNWICSDFDMYMHNIAVMFI